MLPVLAIAVLLLLLEAWISMVETSFFSVPPLILERLRQEPIRKKPQTHADKRGFISVHPRSSAVPIHARRAERVSRLLAHPARLLGTILVSDTLISVALSSATALFAVRLAARYRLSESLTITVCVSVLVLVMLVLGETVPKVLAIRQPLRFALAFEPFVSALHVVLAPVTRVLERTAGGVLRHAHPAPFPTEAELKTMIEAGKERGIIVGNEEEILWNLVELDRRTVSEIMTPRIDIRALDRNETVARALELARATRRSRFPVYDGTIDRVVGMFYVKDFFRLESTDVPVCTVCRDAYFIPEVKKIPTLLDELRRLGVHIAVVVDEFGQTAGIVTLEDVLEVIFGEIRDEYDQTEILPYTRVDERTYSVDGDIDLKTLNRLFRHVFRGQDFERLSGFIHHVLGRLPESGDSFQYRNLRFDIEHVNQNRAERVSITRLDRAESVGSKPQ
jgi:CBS domain containing-hemolysin-like protein